MDFPAKLPDYLPDGMRLTGSFVNGEPGSQCIFVGWVKSGVGGIALQEWRGEKAAAFPPGDSHGEVLDTEPWHKTFKTNAVDVRGTKGSVLTYLLSGINMRRIYWHENGVNYAISAEVAVPLADLVKVAVSLK